MIRVMKIAQNNEVKIPMINVVAKPFDRAFSKIVRMKPVNKVVTLPSMME